MEDTLQPDEVREVEGFAPDGPRQDPSDGHLRGYGFVADVSFVTRAVSVEDGFFTLKPPEGQGLVVFRVQYDIIDYPHDVLHPVRGTVIVDGRRTVVPSPFEVSGATLVAVSLPAEAQQVEFEMASAGLAQTFSLTELRRVGTQPTVVYRDPVKPDVVMDLNTERLVQAEDGRLAASITVILEQVRLSWFSPGKPITGTATDEVVNPTSPETAFLIVRAKVQGVTSEGEGTFEDFGTVPAVDVKVKLADGTVVQARHAGTSDGLLSGAYFVEVPADIIGARLLVGPSTVPAQRHEGVVVEPTSVRVEQAVFDVSFPPGNLASVPATTQASDRSTEPAGKSSGGRVYVWLLLLGAGIAAALAGAFLVRWWRSGEERDATTDEDDVETVDLLSLSDDSRLGVGGTGAVAAVRAAVVSAVLERDTDVLVLAHDETAGLIPDGIAAAPWLTVVHDREALIAAMEVVRVQRARLDEEHESTAGDATGHRPLLVVVPGSVDSAGSVAVDHGWTVVSVGDGAPVRIDGDGRVGGGDGPPRRVPVMAEDDVPPLLAEPLPGVERSVDAASDAVRASETIGVQLLGACRITVGDREVASGLRSKARELLAFLAVNRQGVTGDAAMEALWPGAEPDQAYLRTVVANLRTVLRAEAGPDEPMPVVERVGQRYRLHPARVDVDFWRFEDALAAAGRGDDDAAEAAADAYRGDLLDGEDWPWADPVRERLRRRAVDNLTGLAERRRAAGDLHAALHAGERAVERDPYSEELYQRVMSLHRDLGRPDGARRTYEVLEARLSDLGVTPNARSRALGTDAEG